MIVGGQAMDVLIDKGPVLGGLIVLAGISLYLLRTVLDEDRSAILRARVYRAILAVSKRRDHEKKYLSNDLRGRLNLARRNLDYGREVLPQAVNIEWVEGTSSDTYDLSEGEFIIRLDPAQNQAANIVRMAEAITRRTSLVGLRNVIEKPLREALHSNLVRKLLISIGNRQALDVFFPETLPCIGSDPEFEAWHTRVVEIDDQGLYERLLLLELEDFGRRILGMVPRPYMIGEVEQLVQFVHKLATRREREEVPLQYLRAHMRVGVILVAKAATIRDRGIEPYVEAARIHIETHQVSALYLIVWEKAHLSGSRVGIDYARKCHHLCRAIKSRFDLEEHFTYAYPYVDPNGLRRRGEISRYIVPQVDLRATDPLFCR